MISGFLQAMTGICAFAKEHFIRKRLISMMRKQEKSAEIRNTRD